MSKVGTQPECLIPQQQLLRQIHRGKSKPVAFQNRLRNDR